MIALIAVGAMNLVARVALTAVVWAEKRPTQSPLLPRALALGAIAAALAAAVQPEWVGGLSGGGMPMEHMGM